MKTQKAKLNRGSVAPKRTTRIALRATSQRPSPAYLASVENGIPNVNNAKTISTPFIEWQGAAGVELNGRGATDDERLRTYALVFTKHVAPRKLSAPHKNFST